MTNPVEPITTNSVTPEIGLNPSIDAANLLIEVSGTTVGFADGTEVNVLIMDIMGNSTSVIATIQNGTFLIANIDASQFTPGVLTFTATANDTLVQATEILPEIVSGDPIVITEDPVLNGQNKLTVRGEAPSLKVNDELTLVVRDATGTSVTATALVQADGSFSVTGLSTQGLKDGLLSIDVMALTSSGSISVVNAASVTMTNLTPLGSDKVLQATEDVGLAITAADFGYSNTDGFSMTGVKIAGLPALGTLKLNGVDVVEDQFVSMAQLSAGQLVFQGASNAHGSNYANFKFKVLDNRPVNNEDLVANTITLNVASANDAPTSANATFTVLEDGSKTFSAADFAFADASDSPANALSAIIITSLPAAGTLRLSGVDVTLNQSIPVASLGNLVYAPAANANGNSYASFGFRVQDNGGTANGGVDTSVTANTITINVTPVNDAPVLADTALNLTAVIQGSANPVGAVGVLVSSLVGGVTDVDAGAEKGIAITGFNSAKGQLFFSTNGGINWTEITSATEATARLLKSDADNRVYFKAAAGTQGTVADAVTFRAWDATTGTEGLTGNASVNDGTTAFSKDTDTVSNYVVAPVTINVVSADDLVNPKEPLLITGKADPNAVVTLNINSQNINVTANATGDWSYDGSKVRYIMVRKTLQNLVETDPNYAANGIMTIGDVTVMSGGTNVALNATQTTSNRASFLFTNGNYYDLSIHDGSVAAESSFAEAYGFAVPGGAGGDVWVQLDLGNWYAVDSIDVRARETLGTRANGTKVYASTTDMSALTTEQLNAAVSVGAPSTVTGMTNVGSTTYQVANPVATYANSLLEGPNTITASELVQGVSIQATRVVTLDISAPTITLIGTDDVGPVTGTIAASSVTNDDKPTFSGTTEANAVVKVYDGATLLGTTTANGTGGWSFTPTTAMATGAHSITATATDAAGNISPPTTALPFTIDTTSPVAVADTNTGTEDITTLTGNVGTNDTSKDGSESYAIVGSATGAKGTLVLNANGSYTYTRTSSADEITANLLETFTYRVTDAAGNTTQSTLTITLTPVNDAATFTGDIHKTITETNAAQTVGGTLTVADVDSPTTVVGQVAANGSAGYGKFTISPAGVWSYTMNSAQNQFVAGQTYDDTLTVTTADGTQQVIKVTITGTNDAPTVVSSTSSLGKVFFTENGAPALARGGTITVADAEQVNLQSATVRVVDNITLNPVTGDTLSFTIPGGSGITSSFDAATGTMTFTGSATQAQYQALFDTVRFSNARDDLSGGARNVYYAVKDGSGVSSTEALTRVDVVRQNDAPALDNTVNLSLTGMAPTVSDTVPTGAAGVLVSTLVGGVTDADLKLTTGVDVPKGIAIVGANSALGKVYFSVNGGTTWLTPSFDLADTTALLLRADANTRVFFRPNSGVEGQIANALTIRAWDTTDNRSSVSGTNNVVQYNISTTLGGTNAYSVAVDTVSLNVATVASAPAFNGTSGNDTQTGTAANEVFLGNGGADVITAGAGNDRVVLNANNVTVLGQANSANINGGTGVNILKLIGTELTLDLTNATVAGKVDNFSTVDITSNVNNLLKLNLLNVQTFSGAVDNGSTVGVDESQMMVVLGDTGDAVVLQDAATWSVLNGLKGSDLSTLYGAAYGFSGSRQYSQYSKDGATLFVDELAPVADIVGTSGANTLNGTANADVIYGNGGADTIAAGAGRDTVILAASSLTALASTANTATVNGGTDINTLKLSGINLNLDLTNATVMGKLDNFNVIDMKQGSGNNFKLGLSQVLALAGGTDNAATVGVDESKMLVLQGNGGVAYNTLQLVDSVNWTSVTNLGGTSLQNTYGASFGFEAGRSYTQYSSNTGSANLFVDQTLLHTLL